MLGVISILMGSVFKSRGDNRPREKSIISYVDEYCEDNKKERCRSTKDDQEMVEVARVP